MRRPAAANGALAGKASADTKAESGKKAGEAGR